MAMTKCAECGQAISSKAAACPGCGAKQRRTSLTTKIVGGLLVMGMILAGIGQIVRQDNQAQRDAAQTAQAAALTPEQGAAKAAASARARLENDMRARAYAAAKVIRTAANDPDAIRFAEAGYTDDGTLLLLYRGKNAFNATVMNRAIVTGDGKFASGSESQTAEFWNRHVAGRKVHRLAPP